MISWAEIGAGASTARGGVKGPRQAAQARICSFATKTAAKQIQGSGAEQLHCDREWSSGLVQAGGASVVTHAKAVKEIEMEGAP